MSSFENISAKLHESIDFFLIIYGCWSRKNPISKDIFHKVDNLTNKHLVPIVEKDDYLGLLMSKLSTNIKTFAFLNKIYTDNDGYNYDHSSLKILIRSVLENYLILCHFYFFPNHPHRISVEYDYLRYQMNGINKILYFDEFGKDQEKCNERYRVIQSAKIYIEKKLCTIDKNYIKKCSNKKNHDEPPIPGWKKIGVNSNLPKSFIDNFYSFLCGYAHSGYESVISFGLEQTKTQLDIRDSQKTLLCYVDFLICHIICNFYDFCRKSDPEHEFLIIPISAYKKKLISLSKSFE